MARIVQKFGGTSLANVEKINNAARHVTRAVEHGHEVAVVVSAMSGTTNQLVSWTEEVGKTLDPYEYDVVVSAGEQVTAGLMAMAIQKLGVQARSWLGWQLPIWTDSLHVRAHIEAIEAEEISTSLAGGIVAVVPGFQGIDRENRITTLGRGGSDASAVALAAAIQADLCNIYTDVDGVYTSDPRIVAKARKLDKITYEEMLEMASLGAKVLQSRAAELAMRHRVLVQVLSTFHDLPGTLLVDEDSGLEQQIVSGIAYSRDDAKITLTKIPDKPGVAARIFGPLSEANINVDMIVQNSSGDGTSADLTFTVGKSDLESALLVIEGSQSALEYAELISDDNVAKISVVGVGMRTHAGVAATMFETLADKGINIQVISTSEIKVSVLIAEEYTELALRSLHMAYGLDDEPVGS
jgi:aspartate kinase